MRINEISKKYVIDNKDILHYLETIGVMGKTHSSSLDDGELELLLHHFDKIEKEPEPSSKLSGRFAKIRRPKNWTPSDEKPGDEHPPGLVVPAPISSPSVTHASDVRISAAGTPATPSAVPPQNESTPPAVEAPAAAKVEKVEDMPTLVVEPETAAVSAAPTPAVGSAQDSAHRSSILAPERTPKADKWQAKPVQKKPKPKPAHMEKKEHRPAGAPLIIIEAPEIIPEDIDAKTLAKGALPTVVEKEIPAKIDQDEAIRREIQKLKLKQKRGPEDEPKPQQTSGRSGPAGRGAPAGRSGLAGRSGPAGRSGTTSARRPSGGGASQPRSRGKRAWKREKRERREMQMAAEEQRMQHDRTVLRVHEATTLADIANGLGVNSTELISKLIGMGVMATLNQRLDMDTIQIIADEFNFQVERVDLYDSDIFSTLTREEASPERQATRPPVVTVMGHVDHGKTKLLDAVRSTDVVSQEAGGITQHIGAYYVKTPGGDIVFLDTPGHEAFTAMRARGAMVTDIVILVVAASEGVMPQTKEAIAHARAAGVPIIVALNKIDLPDANPDRVKQQLMENGLMPEEWGGQTVVVPISAKNKLNIDVLLENILIQSELLELKADPTTRARGTILEGRLEQGRGAVATVLIQEGTLRLGDPFVTGVYSGRLRAMTNDRGEYLTVAGPATPVEILGIEDVPTAGDPFIVVQDDSQAKQISARLQQIQRERELKRTAHITLEDLHTQIEEGKIKELRLIVKGDVQGSVGALSESIGKLATETEKVRINIIHSGVGAVTESDVMLASASNALIIGFNVRPHVSVEDLAKREHVDIRTYRIIYEVISDIRNAMTGMLDKTIKETVLGHAEVREVYKVSRSISIAGLYVQDGRLTRNSPVRLLRDSVVVHEGKLSSLKRFKDDVREVASGYECGIGLENFNDIRQGDVVECFQVEEIASTL